MVFTFTELLQFVVVLQSLVMGFFLVIPPRSQQKSNIILAVFLWGLSLQMLGLILMKKNIHTTLLQQINCAYGFFYGPAIYLYARSLIYQKFSFKVTQLVHFLPAVIFFVSALLSFELCQTQSFFIYLFSILTYTGFAYREIYIFQKIIQQTQSDSQRMSLNWLRIALAIFSAIILSDIFRFFLEMLNNHLLEILFEYLIFITMVVFINVMIYKGLSQPKLFSGIEEEDKQLIQQIDVIPQSEPVLSEWLSHIQRIEDYIQNQKPYLQPELNINTMAKEINISSRQLSQIINQHYQTNFSDFINTFRIEEAKKRLLNPKDEKETILEVMYEVGFNSKSSFNTAFRKKTGLTPSEFKSQKG